MAKKKRKVPGLNSSSTADISFILLIFFLVTTSMDIEKGVRRLLPPHQDNDTIIQKDIKPRNIMIVNVNSDGNVMLELGGGEWDEGEHYFEHVSGAAGETAQKYELDKIKQYTKEFIQNKDENEHLPFLQEMEFPDLNNAKLKVPIYHVISLQTDESTKYSVYFKLQQTIMKAYQELRDDLAIKYCGMKYNDCTLVQQQAIGKAIPMVISEAEPKRSNSSN